MRKWFKGFLAVLLLPLCIGATEALGRVLQATGGADTVWVPLLAGVACWLVIYLLLPKPMWLYVAGHELTHVLWTWLFAGRVRRIKVSSAGGHVVINKNNFLITLAPYFFPFYAVAVIAVFAVGHVIWGWNRFLPWFHLCLGAAYGFHVTLTLHVLHTRQPDVVQQGYFFSAVVIWLGNAVVLLLSLPLITAKVTVLTALAWWLESISRLLLRLSTLG